MSFNGLSIVNVELTSICNKDCWMCGRRKVDRDHPEIAMNYGHADIKLVGKIANQLPPNIVVQLHNSGEPLVYPKFGEALRYFNKQIRCANTNGKLLVEKAEEIIGNMDTLTISVIEDDSEQYELVKKFLQIRGDRKPNLIYRCLGEIDFKRWGNLPGILVKRILHNPMGNFGYKKVPIIPEIGICWDLLSHMAIDRFGKVSICVRFDPYRVGVIGDANDTPLESIWESEKRQEWLQHHIEGNRDKVELCSKCEFWGVPRG